MKLNEIVEKMHQPVPKWMGRHDHFFSIPDTKSFVFYPYSEDEADETYLNKQYNPYGYTVVKRPKNESEYNSGQHQTYKVLILEPNFDQLKIDMGCEMIAQFFHDYWSKGDIDVFEK